MCVRLYYTMERKRTEKIKPNFRPLLPIFLKFIMKTILHIKKSYPDVHLDHDPAINKLIKVADTILFKGQIATVDRKKYKPKTFADDWYFRVTINGTAIFSL